MLKFDDFKMVEMNWTMKVACSQENQIKSDFADSQIFEQTQSLNTKMVYRKKKCILFESQN